MLVNQSLNETAQKVRSSARKLAVLSTEQKNAGILAIAQSLQDYSTEIINANVADCQAAKDTIAPSIYARLKLDQSKLSAAIKGVEDVAKLADPVGNIQINRELDSGLNMQRISCPVGVLGVIFEARPDAVIQIASLAIKSGNGVILKGGQEALNSCKILVEAIKTGLSKTDIDPEVIQLLTTREETLELLKLDQYVDLIIPRGSNSFVQFVQNNTNIPVLGHAEGICHLYIDKSADLAMAVAVTVDAKTQYPAACNAIETLLIHQDIADKFLPEIIKTLQEKSVEIRGDRPTVEIAKTHNLTINLANDQDWSTEYSDLILSIKIVSDLHGAIEHINTHGSRHTESIITSDRQAAQTFLGQVDAAGVYHNCSTRFADGFRYGFGAEVGISTQKMPPRGPVGLEGLVTYKYQIIGDGHISATYAGNNPKPFTHRDLD